MKTIQLSMIDRAVYNEDETGGPIESTKPCVVAVDAIRCFYPRKGGRNGTRLTFTDGGGFVVAEAFDDVARKVGANITGVVLQLLPAPTTPAPETSQ